VTHNPSRKEFFAKVFGVAAAAAVVPKLLVKPFSNPAPEPDARPASGPVVVRPETRAVARRTDAI